MSSLETWPLKAADFALMSKDGEVLQCHKDCLAENSEYFAAMLSHEFCETTNNQMKVPDYDGITVASFLEWIYAPRYSEEVMKKLTSKLLKKRQACFIVCDHKLHWLGNSHQGPS